MRRVGSYMSSLTESKSHQNKFHTENLRTLALKFESIDEADSMSGSDRELWEYFSTLYKNSNKGIKGRGKDRRIRGARFDGQDVKFESEGEHTSSSASS